MGQRNPKAKQLIVEGSDNLFAVKGLMSAYVEWPAGNENQPVWIEHGRGVEKILVRDFLGVMLQIPGLTNLGVMLDGTPISKKISVGRVSGQP